MEVIYNVRIHSLDIIWKRHLNQLLPLSCEYSNCESAIENRIVIPQDIHLSRCSQNNANEPRRS